MALKNDVSTGSAAYQRMLPYFQLMRDVIGGTKVMRKAGKKYLPQHPAENSQAYKDRLAIAVLTPFTENLVNYYSSKVFARPLEFTTSSGKLPEGMEDYIEDIDLTGRHLRVFARDLFEEGFSMGIGYIYVESPRNTGKTEAERKAMNARAYFMQIAPENVLDVRMDEAGNITMARIAEYVTEYGEGENEFMEEDVLYIRVVEPTTIRRYRRGDKKKMVMVEEFPNPAGFVPLVPFYANRKRSFEVKPPLAEIAEQNVSHWQFRSNHQNALQVAQFPMMASSGVAADEKKEMEIGPRKWLRAKDPMAKFYYVEHEGKALESGRKYIEDISEEMVAHGIQLLQTSQQNRLVTATEQRIRETTSVSAVQTVAFNLADALENAFVMLEKIGGVKGASQVSVVVNGSFTMTLADVQEIAALSDLNITNRLTLKSLFIELKRRGVLGDTFDIDTEITLLESEGPMFVGGNPKDDENSIPNVGRGGAMKDDVEIGGKDDLRAGATNITNQSRKNMAGA